jgi:hypothetical protein
VKKEKEVREASDLPWVPFQPKITKRVVKA